MYGHGLRRLLAPSLLLVALAGSAGCGGDGNAQLAQEPASTDSASTSGEDVPADAPECSDVWVDGERLARTYQGCVDDSGVYVKRDALGCSSGQRMIRYADRFYGVLGGTVHEAAKPLDEDKDFQAALRRCSA